MNLCSEDCCPICDYCHHYNFNGDKEGRYTGNGFCRLDSRQTDPDDSCDEFHCFTLEQK